MNSKMYTTPRIALAIFIMIFVGVVRGLWGSRMAMFKRTFSRTIPDNLRAPHMNFKIWGFEARRARTFTRTSRRTLAWNFITMLSAAPNSRNSLLFLSVFPLLFPGFQGFVGCTPRGSCNRTLLRRLLRRFSNTKCFLEGFSEGACMGFQSRQGS